MKEYEEYTKCSVPWINTIPSHWKLVRGKNLYKKMQRPINVDDEVVTCFRDGTVTLRKNRRTTGFTESLKEIGYQGIRKGDLVIHVMDAFAGSIGVSDSDGKGTPVYSVCQAKGDSNNQYFAHLLRVMAQKGFIQSLYRGIRERSSDFRFEVFASQFYPVPPRDEQDQIVRFLDWKVSSINKLIKIKKKEIETLKELKKIIISCAVTKGLVSNVKMKDTGISWAKNIPEHWLVKKIKWLCTMKSGMNLVSTDINPENGNFLVYGGNGIRGYYSEYNTDGDYLLIGRQGALCGNIHRVKGKIWATDHAVVTKTNKELKIDYAFYLFEHMNFNQYSSDVAAQPGLSVNKIINLATVLPPIEEQIKITVYLDKKCSQITKSIDSKQKQIETLKDFKTRLISDVVTGKIDVRDIVIPDYEFVAEEQSEVSPDTEEEIENEEQ